MKCYIRLMKGVLFFDENVKLNPGGCTLRAGDSSMALKCTQKCNSYHNSGAHCMPVPSVDSKSFFGLDFTLLFTFP